MVRQLEDLIKKLKQELEERDRIIEELNAELKARPQQEVVQELSTKKPVEDDPFEELLEEKDKELEGVKRELTSVRKGLEEELSKTKGETGNTNGYVGSLASVLTTLIAMGIWGNSFA
eukprot:TRINITY_DN4906_c0_g1_i1.p1 TRINITY_DN4906_c0_g1~~TRINITY_DN4906_c0_g1_i1.p1  ORF type:complete len:118 (-),score=35.95 TRINITY_DN4906_c0_g1_i1:233-586(-)